VSVGAENTPEVRRVLAAAAGAQPSSQAVADAASLCWQRVVRQLLPLIAESGVAALHARCLHLRGIDAGAPGAETADEQQHALFGPVWRDLAARTPEDALDAGVAFFSTFITLLASLIGAALTARLLTPVWADGPPDEPVQENVR
jgi:hypothetical protein